LIEWVTYLEKEGVAFKSVHESIDTTTPTGKLTFICDNQFSPCHHQVFKQQQQQHRIN